MDELSFISFALLALRIIILNEYFEWKSKYYFVYILLHLGHITGHLVQLSSVVKHLLCFKFNIKTRILQQHGYLRHNVPSRKQYGPVPCKNTTLLIFNTDGF
jgi:hypothetical protein